MFFSFLLFQLGGNLIYNLVDLLNLFPSAFRNIKIIIRLLAHVHILASILLFRSGLKILLSVG